MKLIQILLGAWTLALAAGTAAAQEQDQEALKRKILREVEERIRKEEDRLLKEIEKIIDEELGRRKQAPGAAPVPPPPPEPPPPPPPAPKKARGYVGIRAANLEPEEKEELGVKGGFRIVEVLRDSPADQAGLKADDVVVAIDGRAVDVAEDVRIVAAAAGAGTTLTIDLLRDGKKQTVKVTLGRHPDDPAEEPPKKADPKAEDLRERVKKFLDKGEKPEAPKAEPPPPAPEAPREPSLDMLLALDAETFRQLKETFDPLGVDLEQFFEKGKDGKYRLRGDFAEMFRDFQRFYKEMPGEGEEPGEEMPGEAPQPEGRPWIGIQPEALSDELRAQLDVEKGVGLLLADVIPGSPAEKAGLKKHDVLLRIDGKPVQGEETLARFMEGARVGQEVTLTILRKAREEKIKVRLVERKEE